TEGERVLGSEEMDRAAHAPDANGLPGLDQHFQFRRVELLDPAPQADIRRFGRLRLHAGKPRQRVRDWRALTDEQHLPSEQRAIEVARRQRLAGTRRRFPTRRHYSLTGTV